MSTEVSTPSSPSNSGIKRHMDIQQCCVGCITTACMTVAMPPTLKTPQPKAQSANQNNVVAATALNQAKVGTTTKCDVQRQCCLASGRIRLTTKTTLSDDLAS